MPINIQQIVSLLGSQTKFIPTRTDNLHTAKKKNNQYEEHEANAAAMWLGNNSTYQNFKIPASSAPKDYCWLVLDYDDKQKTGKIPIEEFRSLFGIVTTFSIKTPTGAGRQDWYLISEKDAAKLPKPKYSIAKFKNVEIFIGHKDSRQIFVAPGSKKKDIEYKLQNAIKPTFISQQLIDALLVQAGSDFKELNTTLDTNLVAFNTELDSQVNKKQFINYINNVISDFELGEQDTLSEGDGRDNFIFQQMVQGFTYNLSKEFVRDIVSSKIISNEKVIHDPNNEFNEEIIGIKVLSAYNYVTDALRSEERSQTKDLEPFEENSRGIKVVTREALTKKVLYLSKFSHNRIVSDPRLRALLCETIVYGTNTGTYFVARILSHKQYEKHYTAQLEKENNTNKMIDIDGILSKRNETILHWQEIDSQQLRQMYRYLKGQRLYCIDHWKEFFKYSFSCHVHNNTTDESIIIDDDTFYLIEKSAIEILPLEQITNKERKQIKEIIYSHIRRIVDPNNFDEEAKWLLDRYALLLQNPGERIENLLIIKGSQGSGKTSFINIMMSMFPISQRNTFYTLDDVKERFFDIKPISHFDDINLNSNNAVINKLKGLISTGTIPIEKKFKNRVLETGSFNPSFTTNDPIENAEFLFGRRNTILENTSLISVNKVAEEVRNTLIALKANDWRLYRVLYTLMLNRDVSDFKSNYKTKIQNNCMLSFNKGNDFGIGLANMIANYGYISPGLQVAIPKENINRNDFNAILFNHYLLLDNDFSSVVEPKDLREINKLKLFTKFSNTREKRGIIKAEFDSMFTNPESKQSSVINKQIHSTYVYTVPPIKDWIKLLTVVLMGSTEITNIEYVVETFGFERQYEGKKPNVENLGTINVYDSIEIEDFQAEEEY